jgi:hypothetical protein
MLLLRTLSRVLSSASHSNRTSQVYLEAGFGLYGFGLPNWLADQQETLIVSLLENIKNDDDDSSVITKLQPANEFYDSNAVL